MCYVGWGFGAHVEAAISVQTFTSRLVELVSSRLLALDVLLTRFELSST